jgi:hypothetical protein
MDDFGNTRIPEVVQRILKETEKIGYLASFKTMKNWRK